MEINKEKENGTNGPLTSIDAAVRSVERSLAVGKIKLPLSLSEPSSSTQ